MTTLPKKQIVIIGAGPTGLGAAWRLHQSGFEDWALYEREDAVGGLAGSYFDEKGFTWDVGVHVTHSHYHYFTEVLDDLFGPSGWLKHERESWVRAAGAWVPYPFQHNLHRLPPEVRADCVEGLLRAAMNGSEGAFANFDDFIARTFGQGIADVFMRPYNRKIWTCEPDEMDAGWIADRVAVPDAVRVARNLALNRDDTSWGPNNTFRFPATGGTGAIWREIAARLPAEKLHLGIEAVALDADARTITLDDGTDVRYDSLISTMPIDQLSRISGRIRWIDLATRLSHTSTRVVGVALDGKPPTHLETMCWIYFPGEDCPFYRVGHFSRFSPNNVDDIRRRWSLVCEVAESSERRAKKKHVAEECIRGLAAAGVIDSPEQVHHTWVRRFEYGYPTPTLGRDDVVNDLLAGLYKAGILSRGRFGAWRYEVGNMDHSFMQGVEAADHVIRGRPETTLWNPALVNSSRSTPKND